jgi:hypothetical protein
VGALGASWRRGRAEDFAGGTPGNREAKWRGGSRADSDWTRWPWKRRRRYRGVRGNVGQWAGPSDELWSNRDRVHHAPFGAEVVIGLR